MTIVNWLAANAHVSQRGRLKMKRRIAISTSGVVTKMTQGPLVARVDVSRAGCKVRAQKISRTCLALFAASSSLAIAIPVRAHAQVYTYAKSGDEGNQVFAGYNVDTQDDYVYYNAPVGATRRGGCAPPATACVASSSGTQGTNPNQTASFDQTSLADTDGGGPSNGMASARADLATGQLGVAATGTQRTRFGDSGDGVAGSASASFGDGLNFFVAGASATTSTNVGVTIALDGSFVVTSPYTGSSLRNQLTFGNAAFSTDDGFGIVPNAHTASGWVSYLFSPDTAGNIVFTGVYALTGASQHVDFFESLFTHSGNGETTDFNRTSRFTLNLPTNVSYTSDSGVFLTATNVPSGVPEPSIWLMMIGGFALIGISLRRRRGKLADLHLSKI